MYSYEYAYMSACKFICSVLTSPFESKSLFWGCLDIKMSSYQYKDPHVKKKDGRDCLIFNMGILIPGKMVFILRQVHNLNQTLAIYVCVCVCWGGGAVESHHHGAL